MIIGSLVLDIHFPSSHSLKEKRRDLNRIRDRLKRFNVSYAEIDFQNKWQRTQIAVVTVNSSRKIIESHLNKVLRDIEENTEGVITQSLLDYF